MKYALTVDAGTGSCRAILFDDGGRAVARSQREWHYDTQPGADGAVVFDPRTFWGVVLDCLRRTVRDGAEAGAAPSDILTVCVTGQREGMVYLDAAGEEIYSAPSLDLRGAAMLPMLAPREAEIYETTGLPLHGMFGLARLAWFREHAPETYRRIHTAFMISDWIAYRLCGVAASEPSVASSSQMFAVRTGRFAADLLDSLGLRNDIFPPVVPAGKPLGRMRAEAAAELGIPGAPWVCLGGSDSHAGLVGIGAVHPGDVGVIAGTTTPVMQVRRSPFYDPAGRLFSNCHAVEGLWVCEGNGGSTGLSQRWAKQLFMGGDSASSFADMEREARKAPPGAHGMAAFIGAELAGERTGENLGGFIFPVPWDIEEVTLADFCRAVIETNAFAVRANLDLICGRTGERPGQLLLCGGQSASPLFTQILADVTGLPVTVFRERECTALGAAIAGFCGAGYYPDRETAYRSALHVQARFVPEEETALRYGACYERWQSIRRRMTGC